MAARCRSVIEGWMRIPLLTATAAAFALFASATASMAAEGRDNPFTVPPTKAEEQARQDDRTRRIVRELSTEIQAKVMQEVQAAQALSEADMKRRIDEAAAKFAATPAATAPTPQGAPTTPVANGAPVQGQKGGQQNTKPGDAAGDGSKFISCVNGKALYRDKDNTLFQVSGIGPSGVDRCAR